MPANTDQSSTFSRLPDLLTREESSLLAKWTARQQRTMSGQNGLMKQSELAAQCTEFLGLLRRACASNNFDIWDAAWDDVRAMLAQVSRSRAQQGFTPTETATFVFSFKEPLLGLLGQELREQPDELMGEVMRANNMLDALGLWTSECFLKAREEVIARQGEELLELSTPVVKLWDGVLALPLIGTLDSARTQVVMESLLQRIVETGSEIAIIDITGVPTVDTLVAQHLIKTVTAARLMGAECIISGIRPQIAQTIVHLGVDLSGVLTKASLADAFKVALRRNNIGLTRLAPASSNTPLVTRPAAMGA